MPNIYRNISLLLLIVAAILTGLTPPADQALAYNKPDLKGTWKLVSRTLPDSVVVDDSLISGTIVYTKSTKHLNMSWKNENGKWETITHIAKYIFDSKAYAEENSYYLHSIAGKKDSVMINASDTASGVDVEVRNYGYWFKFPLHNGPKVYFTGPFMKIYEDGVYSDHWVRQR